MSRKFGQEGFIREELARKMRERVDNDTVDAFFFGATTWARQAGKQKAAAAMEELQRMQHERNRRQSARARFYPEHITYLAPRDRPRDALQFRRQDNTWSLQ